MTDEQFYKQFYFNLYQHGKSYMVDRMNQEGSPMHYVAQLLNGSGRISSSNGTIYLQPGDYFYIPAGLRYQSFWSVDEKELIRFYSFGFQNFPNHQSVAYGLQKLNCNVQARALFEALTETIAVNSLSVGRLYTFLGFLEDSMEVSPESKRNQMLERALEYMNSRNDYTVQEIAAYCHMSESGIYAMFQRLCGKTPVEMKHQILSERAVELLTTTDLSVEAISERLQISSSSYFRKIFKEQTGKTPREVRKAAAALYKI